jgi:NAD(P)-dependent dehydrogenase (short-subunit alcohol dehydrogenase family)
MAVLRCKAHLIPSCPTRDFSAAGTGADAIAFLLSDDASYITGAHLAADGGLLA